MNRFLLCLCCVLACSFPAFAGPEADYVEIYQLIQEADSLRGRNQAEDATARYEKALSRLKALQETHASWNASVVRFRLDYIARQLEGIDSGTTRPAAEDLKTRIAEGGLSREALDALKLEMQAHKMLSAKGEPLDKGEKSKERKTVLEELKAWGENKSRHTLYGNTTALAAKRKGK